MKDTISKAKMYDISLNSGNSEVPLIEEPKKRGRKKASKRGRKKKVLGLSEIDGLNKDSDSKDIAADDLQKKQEKIEKRKELMKLQMEEIKWQAVDRILNEKGRKEREREKKLKKEIEENIAKQAAIEEKKKLALTNIRIKYLKDGQITLSFPRGFLLPRVLEQEKLINGDVSKKSIISVNNCKKCGKLSKYCNSKSKNYSCSLECYKELN